MTNEEFDELLKITGWTKRKLAQKLNLSENLVYQWYSASASSINRTPTGPAAVLMSMWLRKARRRKVAS